MILIKDKNTENTVVMVNPTIYKVDTYTLLIQNTLTKEVSTITANDNGDGIYLKFNVDLSGYPDGEYILFLFDNCEQLPFEVYANDLKGTQQNVIYFLSDGKTLLKEGDFFIVEKGKTHRYPLKQDLLKIGNYRRNKTVYTNEQTYIQYNK